MILVPRPPRPSWSGRTRAIDHANLRSLLLPHAGGVFDAISGTLDPSIYATRPPQKILLDSRGKPVTGRGNPTTTGGQFWYGPGAVLAPVNYTRVLVVQVSTTGPLYGGVYTVSTTDGATAHWAYQDTGDSTNAHLWHNNSNRGLIGTWAALASTRYETYVFRSANSATVDWWLNGVKQSSIASGAAPSAPPTSARAVFGGARDASTGTSQPCSVGAVATFDAVLSDEQCEEFSRDWRKLLKARYIWVPVSAAGGTTHNVTLTESASAADAAVATILAAAAASESITSTDALTALLTGVASLTEAASASDAQTGSTTRPADLTESAALAETLAAVTSLAAALTEAASATDLQAAVTLAVAAVTEAISATEAQSTSPIVVAAVTEAATATDAATAIATLAATLSEAASPIDALTAAALLVGTLAESVNAADAVTQAAQLVALLTESASLVDTQSTEPGAVHFVSIDELADATDLLVAVLVGRGVISAPPLGRRLSGSARQARESTSSRTARQSRSTR